MWRLGRPFWMLLFSAMPACAFAGSLYTYNGGWKVCVDAGGYTIYKPDGGNDFLGSGYTLEEVEDQYRLTERKEDGEC